MDSCKPPCEHPDAPALGPTERERVLCRASSPHLPPPLMRRGHGVPTVCMRRQYQPKVLEAIGKLEYPSGWRPVTRLLNGRARNDSVLV